MAGTLRQEISTGSLEGIPVITPTANRNLLNLPPSPPFFFKFHPERWTMIGGEWLPQLGVLRVEPGVNCVDARGDHTIAQARAMKAGWTLIPWEILPDGYVRAFAGSRGTVHLSRWEHPRQIAGRVIVDIDDAGYQDFLRDLMARGIIPLPDPAVLDILTEGCRKRVERAASRPESEGARRAVSKAEARVAAMEAATEKILSPESEAALVAPISPVARKVKE